MRSSKAPPNQKNRGKFYSPPPNLASEPHKCNARWGFLGTSVREAIVIINLTNMPAVLHDSYLMGNNN